MFQADEGAVGLGFYAAGLSVRIGSERRVLTEHAAHGETRDENKGGHSLPARVQQALVAACDGVTADGVQTPGGHSGSAKEIKMYDRAVAVASRALSRRLTDAEKRWVSNALCPRSDRTAQARATDGKHAAPQKASGFVFFSERLLRETGGSQEISFTEVGVHIIGCGSLYTLPTPGAPTGMTRPPFNPLLPTRLPAPPFAGPDARRAGHGS
jgi:hypothetical protein